MWLTLIYLLNKYYSWMNLIINYDIYEESEE